MRTNILQNKYKVMNNMLKVLHDEFGKPQMSVEQTDSLSISAIAMYLQDISISLAMIVDNKCGESFQDMLESEDSNFSTE